MNAQDLKNSILQLAIQGKLVEQRPEEGTAEELYKKIQEEKKKLIKEGKIKKTKALPEITEDEIPFDIPENWKWVRLEQVGLLQTGNTPSKTHLEYFGGPIPFITPGDILNGNINYHNHSLSEVGSQFGRIAEANSIMQVCIGGSISKGAINKEKVAFNQQINVITPYLNDQNYIYYCMISNYFYKNIRLKATGTATPIINKTSWGELLLPLPPLEEQKRIVAKIEELIPFVDKYDAAYSELEALNKKFPEDMQKSILQHAIQGKLVEQREDEGTAEDLYNQIQEEKKKLIKEGKIKKTKALPEITEDEIPFDIPESWKWVRLGEVIHLTSGQDMNSKSYNDLSKGIPYLTGASNIHEGKILINRWTEEPRAKACKGDLLLTCKGTVGKTVILEQDEVHIARQIMSIRAIIIVVAYLQYFVKSYISILKSKAKSIIPGIERKDVLEAPLPLPPLAEQKRIVAKIKELMPYTKQLVK